MSILSIIFVCSLNDNSLFKQKHKDGKILIKGHKFVDIKYRMPTYCDACNKPLWDLFNPPAAIECLCKTLIITRYKNYSNVYIC